MNASFSQERCRWMLSATEASSRSTLEAEEHTIRFDICMQLKHHHVPSNESREGSSHTIASSQWKARMDAIEIWEREIGFSYLGAETERCTTSPKKGTSDGDSGVPPRRNITHPASPFQAVLVEKIEAGAREQIEESYMRGVADILGRSASLRVAFEERFDFSSGCVRRVPTAAARAELRAVDIQQRAGSSSPLGTVGSPPRRAVVCIPQLFLATQLRSSSSAATSRSSQDLPTPNRTPRQPPPWW